MVVAHIFMLRATAPLFYIAASPLKCACDLVVAHAERQETRRVGVALRACSLLCSILSHGRTWAMKLQRLPQKNSTTAAALSPMSVRARERGWINCSNQVGTIISIVQVLKQFRV